MNLAYFLHINRSFSDFSPHELAALEQVLTVASYPDGHVFVREGEPGSAMYLIMEGQVLVTRGRQNDGSELPIGTLGPGEMFGLISLIDHGPRCATCRAAGEVTAASLDGGVFASLFEADDSLALRFQYLIARQLANDLRIYNQAIADSLVAPEDPARLYDMLGQASLEYRFPRIGAKTSSIRRS